MRAAPTYTEVGGPIISDTTWTLADSPYIVTTNVQVTTGVTLTVEAGVVVSFNRDTLLQVDGTLIARGTAGNPITFTSSQASPARGDWQNIAFTDSSADAAYDGAGNYTGGSILEYCVVEYGGNGVTGAVQTDQASPLIDHCTVRDNSSSGIHAVGASGFPVIIRNNAVSANSATSVYSRPRGGGIYAEYSTVTGNTISDNSSGGPNYAPGDGSGIYAKYSTVTGNTVSGNSTRYWGNGGGIFALGSTVTGNTVSDNSADYGGGIHAEVSAVTGNTVSGNSGAQEGGGIYAASSSVMSNTVSGNSVTEGVASWGRGGGGIYAEGSTVTNNTVSGNSAYGGSCGFRGCYINVCGGGIFAEGSMVTGNSVSDNSAYSNGGGIYAGGSSTVTGNSVSGNSASACGGGIFAFSSPVISNTISGNLASACGGGIFAFSSPVISNTVTANGFTSAIGWNWGVGVYLSGSADFLYNTIVGNTTISPTGAIGGVAIDGTPRFQHNNLYGNANYDVVLLSSSDITGTENFWGMGSTADIQAHIYDGHDDAARGKMLHAPFLQDPDTDAPVPPPQNLRANFTSDSASLSWDAIPSTTTGYGYKVYYDTDRSGPPYQGAGAAEGDSPIDVGNATHFTLSGLEGRIYVAVTAYDTKGRESWYSNEAMNLWRTFLPMVLNR